MVFVITIFRDEDGMFIAECPSIPGCVSQGKTEQRAVKNVQLAIKACLEVRSERGMPLTVTTNKTSEGSCLMSAVPVLSNSLAPCHPEGVKRPKDLGRTTRDPSLSLRMTIEAKLLRY